MPLKFEIELLTKPYVRQHIIFSYGNPADFSIEPEINDRFRRCLSKPSRRAEKIYEELSMSRYSTVTKVAIIEDDFYRYGWELTRTDTIAFGKFIERRAKFIMRTMVSFYSTMMMQRDAILKFQKVFGYTEDTWPFESIKKDFDRYGPVNKINLTAEITEKIEKIILVNLSVLGTTLPTFQSNYEHNKKTA